MNSAVLLNQVDFVRNGTLELLRQVPEEVADLVPPGFSNSIRWNVGHILIDQEQWLYSFIHDGMKLSDRYLRLFAHGTKPSDWQEVPPSLDELAELLGEQAQRIRRDFGHRLNKPLLRPAELGMSTIGEIIPRTLYHEGIHAGIISSMLRMIKQSV
ncbi:MAG: DinB family protein [Brevibacillus sp.]|nr:DinB family protein [Brevibacillus sp.]